MISPEVSWAINSISGFRTVWDPHVGCAVLAGKALLEQELVESDARPHVQAVIDSIMSNHSAGEATQPVSDANCTREDILSVLAEGGPKVCQLSHDAIYSSYILYALAANPQLENGQIWASAARLIGKLRKSGPGWITINGKNTVLPAPIVPGEGMAKLNNAEDILNCFSSFNRSERMEKGDQQLGHLLTHGHAIYRLYKLGHTDLADDASKAFWDRIQILNHANTLETEMLPFETLSLAPEEAAFWKLAVEKWTGSPDHLLKYTYSFLELRRESQLPKSGTAKAFCRILCSLNKN